MREAKILLCIPFIAAFAHSIGCCYGSLRCSYDKEGVCFVGADLCAFNTPTSF